MLRRLLILPLLALPAVAHAEDKVAVTIENHVFSPAEIRVKANRPTVLEVENRDATPEEFDSSALKVEKIIPGHGKATLRLRPLAAGRYEFDGEYHEDTAKGVVIAE